MGAKAISVGDSASFSKTLTETDVYNFAGICGDFNPLHLNKEIAGSSRFGSRVCHGMLVSSFISTVLGTYLPGPGTIYLEQTLRFEAPVYFGDTITTVAIVEEIKGKVVRLQTTVTNQKGEEVITGFATVMIP